MDTRTELTDEEFKTFTDWIDSSFPEGVKCPGCHSEAWAIKRSYAFRDIIQMLCCSCGQSKFYNSEKIGIPSRNTHET